MSKKDNKLVDISSFSKKMGILDSWKRTINNYNRGTQEKINKLYREFKYNKSGKTEKQLEKLFNKTFNIGYKDSFKANTNSKLFTVNKDGKIRGFYNPKGIRKTDGNNSTNTTNSINDMVNNIDDFINRLDDIGFGFNYIGAIGDNYRSGLKWVAAQCGLNLSEIDEFDMYNLIYIIQQNKTIFQEAFSILDRENFIVDLNDIYDIDYVIRRIDNLDIEYDEQLIIEAALIKLK